MSDRSSDEEKYAKRVKEWEDVESERKRLSELKLLQEERLRDLECRIANQRKKNEAMRKKLKERDDILSRAGVDPVCPQFTKELKVSSDERSGLKLANLTTKEKIIKKIPTMAVRIKHKSGLEEKKEITMEIGSNQPERVTEEEKDLQAETTLEETPEEALQINNNQEKQVT